MDNGVKAIIIAGTILIVIMVVTFITMFFYKAGNATKTVHGEEFGSDVISFNSQFSIYDGNDKTKSEIDKLVAKVNASNKNADYIITINGVGVQGNEIDGYEFDSPSTHNGSIVTYTVIFDYNQEGRLNSVEIN